MKQHVIGSQSFGRIGLGCMGMSCAYGPGGELDDNLKVLDRALELGVNHWDTADLYGAGENEKLLSHRVSQVRDQFFLATKFANVFDRTLTSHQDQVAANAPWIVDGTPEYIRKCIDNSLSRLGVDHVDLYYQHRVDPMVPIEESVGALGELVKEGKILNIGLSEASAETIRKAHAVHPIAAVQSELSLWTRDYMSDVIPVTGELGITFVAYSPLGRGFLTGKYQSVDDFAPDDWRRRNPRFAGEAFAANMAIVEKVKEVAARHDATLGQVALAWVLAQGDHVVTIPGTKRIPYLEENAAADSLVLSAADLADLNSIEPPSGARYEEFAMSFVNG
ncbi:MAG: aldo/keto reductase [Armatimonadetes bacterium]|nr:aldo/keto reductase [Armatimonadota bacterium]